jgi:hypothetical protein
MQVADHDLAIDEILGAAEGNEADFDHEKNGRDGIVPPRLAAEADRAAVLSRLFLGGLDPGLPALEVGKAALLLDDFVVLLAHG